MNEIICAFISAAAAIIVCIVNSNIASSKIQKQMEVQVAITNTRLEELTREVRAHNNFAQRMPVIEEKISVINHRLKDLEDDSK